MIKFKWYRWLNSFLGYSSFFKKTKKGDIIYILVRGDRQLVESLQKHYTQEY